MRTIITILLLLAALPLIAQQDLYIAPGTRLQVGNTEAVSIYGSVVNDGALGTADDALVHFFGKAWRNGMGAALPDNSQNGFSAKGGLFRFSGDNPLYGNVGAQQVFGGYSIVSRLGATFPNLEVNNRLGVLLADLSDLKVRNNLHFSSGHLFLNGWNLVVGDGRPGTITGYSEQSFVITGTGIAGGFLYREQVDASAGKVVFPIGTSISTYAPAVIEYAGAADDVRARVFDSVYQYAISGLTNKLDFANKTWNIAKTKPDAAETKLTLQHMDADEGRDYAAFRAASYVTRFMNNEWDYQENPVSLPVAGNITTTGTLQHATMHYRILKDGISTNEYFTKASVLYGPYAPAVFIQLNAYRLNENFVQLEWAVSSELNNDHFDIERRYDNEPDFTKAGEAPSIAPNGNTSIRMDYRHADPNGYDGWTYYRIKAVSKNGRVSYSEIKAVPPFLRVDVWPNPNMGQFEVRVRGQQTELLMQIVNSMGQLVEQYEIAGERTIRVQHLAKGTYLLVFYDKATQRLVRTFKVIVIDRR
ncbi:T9SS type A sorting domain-containing protein [Chitinophaga sp.]|uniref:T9SS type A sorting domain-containing protein n=1 Tax=Chitinophaga sp. TaxID=1869181 RepID=UPI0031CFBF1C